MTVLGLLAGMLTTLSFLPQVVRTFRTGTGRALSALWLLTFGAGVVGWILYGVLTGDIPVIASNVVMLGFVVSLIVLRTRSAARERVPASPGTAR